MIREQTLTASQPMTHRLLSFDLIARCAIVACAAFTTTLAWLVPTSLTAKIIVQGGTAANALLIGFSVVVAVALIDIFINDFLPDRYILKSVKARRHKLYHYLAAAYFIQSMGSVGPDITIEDTVAAYYFLIGSLAAWYSWAVACRGDHV